MTTDENLTPKRPSRTHDDSNDPKPTFTISAPIPHSYVRPNELPGVKIWLEVEYTSYLTLYLYNTPDALVISLYRNPDRRPREFRFHRDDLPALEAAIGLLHEGRAAAVNMPLRRIPGRIAIESNTKLNRLEFLFHFGESSSTAKPLFFDRIDLLEQAIAQLKMPREAK